MSKTFYELSNNESKLINISKVLFSILVVFVHVYGTNFTIGMNEYVLLNPDWLEIIKVSISKVISSSAVPAFFFFSSILLHRKEFSWKSNMRKKCRSLLVPYLLLNTFWIIFDAIPFTSKGVADLLENGLYLFSWGVRDWEEAYIGALSGYPCLYQLWFVRELILLNIIALLIKKLIDFKPEMFIGLITALYFFIDTKYVIVSDCDGVYNHILTALFFWTIGYIFVKYNIKLENFLSRINIVLITAVYFILVISSTILYEKVFIDFIVRRICTVVGIVFWVKISSLITKEKVTKVLLYISSFSFSIYIFHEKALTYFRRICVLILPKEEILTSLFMYFVTPIIIIVCCIILSLLMKKFTPRLYSLITGNRTNIVQKAT